MNLALNNLQRLICHKPNQQTKFTINGLLTKLAVYAGHPKKTKYSIDLSQCMKYEVP